MRSRATPSRGYAASLPYSLTWLLTCPPQELLERESEALITLGSSSQKLLPIIASGLSEQLSVVQKVRIPPGARRADVHRPHQVQPQTDEIAYKVARSERYLLDLLRKCLSAQWNQIVRFPPVLIAIIHELVWL